MYAHLGITDLDQETNGQSHFFRSLGNNSNLVELLRERKRDNFEIAVVGCSEGEEAFSLALLCVSLGYTNLTVHGYDINHQRIERANKKYIRENATNGYGINRGAALGVDPSLWRKDRCFIKFDKRVADATEFFQHDIREGPLPQQYDLVSCHCVFMYLNDQEGEVALRNILESRKPNGIPCVDRAAGKYLTPEQRSSLDLEQQRRIFSLVW